MQPNGSFIVDTICRTAELGVTITGAAENGDVTVIEACLLYTSDAADE